MDELLKALGPKTALVMIIDDDGLTVWGDCSVITLEAERDVEDPPESQVRLNKWGRAQLDLAV